MNATQRRPWVGPRSISLSAIPTVLAVVPADQYIADIPAYRRRPVGPSPRLERKTPSSHSGSPRRDPRPVTVTLSELSTEGVFDVGAFREKPDRETALGYLADGGFLWNAGMFFMPASLAIRELERFEPELLAGLRSLFGDAARPAAEVYPSLKSISIDYAVMERTDRVRVIGSFGWSDVGSRRRSTTIEASGRAFRQET